MGIQLAHASVTAVSLPWPALSASIDIDTNQSTHRSAGGTLYTVKHGPSRYTVTRVFEGLTDTEVKNFNTFFKDTGELGASIFYRYTPHGGVAKNPPCMIVEKPKFRFVHKNNWDLTIVFEQSTLPNRESDPNL